MSRYRLLAGAAVLAALAPGAARADFVYIANGYHFQQTPFYCGPGSMEMMLDSPAVTSLNAGVAASLNTAAANNTPQTIFVNGTFGFVNNLAGDNALQNNLYQGVWGGYAAGAYANSMGTPPAAFTTVMNAADNQHNYANYNFVPTLLAGDLASRTVAAALKAYGVPATVAVESGAHWIDVNGVSTTGTIGRNQAYTINGFFVRDPWTGLAARNPGLAALGGMGLGYSTYLRYGIDRIGSTYRLAPWFRYFNPTGSHGIPPNSYSIIVEPQGPELPDTIDPTATGSTPDGIPITNALGSFIDQSTALSDATSDLSGNADLNSRTGLSGGSFDSANAMELTLNGDTGGDQEWLVPYDGSGGTNDVTGALMIDAATGLIDEAIWFDGSNGVNSVTLADLRTWGNNQANGLLPQDNLNIPEPASAGALLAGLIGLATARRKNRACVCTG